MKKLLLILFLLPALSRAQQVDTVIDAGIYKSYYSYATKGPLYVVYTLYKGGGDCSRSGMTFKDVGLRAEATQKDYAKSGFDIGHMTNCADMANDCKKEEATFRFYNALPQTPRLNRGCWKVWETTIRKESQTDSLLIMCGGIFGNKTIGLGNIGVPDYCWKIIRSLTTGQVTHCLIFPNDDSDTYQKISVEDLLKELDYTLTNKLK